MENLLIVARQVAILFVLMGVGVVLRRRRLLADAAEEGLVNILLLLVTPSLIISSFQRTFDPALLRNLGCAFAFAVAAHLLVIAAAHLLVRHPNEDTRRPLQLAAVFSNAGFMGLPLQHALFGDLGVFYGIVYVAVFNIFVWSWGLRMMYRGDREGVGAWKMVVNPGTVGLIIALPLFLFSVRLPDILAVPIRQLGDLNTPLAMLVIGYELGGAKMGRVARMKEAYLAAFVRLVAYPLAVIALLYPFRSSLGHEMMLALTVAASAPVAAMTSMFAVKYRRDVDTSVALVSATTLLSIVTMPVIVAFAMSVF